jgi:hypothetical protein
MLNSGKKIRALRDRKKIRTLVLSEKKFLNETKKHNPPPPLQLKWKKSPRGSQDPVKFMRN